MDWERIWMMRGVIYSNSTLVPSKTYDLRGLWIKRESIVLSHGMDNSIWLRLNCEEREFS